MKLRRVVPSFLLMAFLVCHFAPAIFGALTSSYADNYAVPEAQPGYLEEQYEVKSASKLHRGLENFFLSPLEIPHGVKTEFARKRADYLEPGIESFFIGAFQGVLNGFKRAGVGLYEIVTFPYAQGPILEEMEDWLY